MSRRPSSRQAVEIVWQSLTESAVDPEPALAVLKENYDDGTGIMEHFSGQFYHLSRSAYAAIARNDITAATPEFNDTARHLLHDVMEVVDGTDYHPNMTDFYGVANELTPIALGPLYLASRADDLYRKTDLYFNDGQQDIPVQMKTDECYTIAAAPEGGVLVTAKDFGNEDFAISRAVVESETSATGKRTAQLSLAAQALTECIQRRFEDPEGQAAELALKASRVRGPKFKKPKLTPMLHRPFATDAMRSLEAALSFDLRST